MGCVACVNTIDSSLRKVDGVQRVASELKPLGAKGGTATVVVATQEDTKSVTNRLVEAIADAGFDGASLISMRPNSAAKPAVDS